MDPAHAHDEMEAAAAAAHHEAAEREAAEAADAAQAGDPGTALAADADADGEADDMDAADADGDAPEEGAPSGATKECMECGEEKVSDLQQVSCSCPLGRFHAAPPLLKACMVCSEET